MKCPPPIPLPDFTCSDLPHITEIRGDQIFINGQYRGHITAVKGVEVELKYNGYNKYMKGLKSRMVVGCEVVEALKDISL